MRVLCALLWLFCWPIPCAGLASAQDAVSTPVADSWKDHVTAAARREYRASGMRLIGLSALVATVYEFDSAVAAEDAFVVLLDDYRDDLDLGVPDVRRASAPRLGDERLAYAGSVVMSNDPDASAAQVGLVAWRDERFVIVLFAAGFAGDPLPETFAVARAIEGRRPEEASAITVSAGEPHTGDVWDLLPTFDDVPEGFVFIEDTS